MVFAGSPTFALPSLGRLLDAGFDVVGVITQPDRRAGRGRQLRPSPVKEFAVGRGLAIFQPESLKSADVAARLRSMRPDLMIVVAYGLLLPAAILSIPERGCVNVHASLLPRWRGASPIQAAILAGDKFSGVSIMRMETGLDSGPIYATRQIQIGDHETGGELEARLAEIGAELLLATLGGILDGSSRPRDQEETGVTHAGRIAKAQARIDWHESAIAIDRRIRAYNPWPVAETLLDGARLRCWAAEPAAGNPFGGPGEVIGAADGYIEVVTGDGVLRLTQLQLPGRQKVSAAAFANGLAVVGKVLGS